MKIVFNIVLSCICVLFASFSYAQVIEFSDSHTIRKFKLSVGAVRFKKDSIYNAESGKDVANQYHAELIFSKYSYNLKIFDNKGKSVLTIQKLFVLKGFGVEDGQDGFLKSYDLKTKTEHYQYTKGGFDVSFQNGRSYPDNWIEIHIITSINREIGHTTGKYLVFAGRGGFLYNVRTHEVKQS